MEAQTRNGISSSLVVTPTEIRWPSVLAFLIDRFPHLDPTALTHKMRSGKIYYDDGSPVPVDATCIAGQRLWYFREIENETVIPFDFEILHEDEHLLVIDKPHFLSTTPVGNFLRETVVTRLRKQTGNMEITPAHRLDRSTAGILMLTKHKAAREKYQSLFARRDTQKIYHAICHRNALLPEQFDIRLRLQENQHNIFVSVVQGEPNSETSVKLLHSNTQYSLYQLKPVSGRKHQLRVHLANQGAGIVNDNWYPIPQPEGPDDFNNPLQLLAVSLAFIDPFSGQRREFQTRRSLSVDRLLAN
ncbi:MAG: pseudouridine synthase [Reinekea sp.]